MKRLIDADAYLESQKPNGVSDEVWKESTLYKSISSFPSAQIERKKGHWLIDEEWGTCYCSECKEENAYAYDWNIKRYTDNFCPNCGAQMIQEEGKQ